MKIEQFSMGIGDRFGRQGLAQLRAFQMAAKQGVKVVPVWNKSNREHSIIGTMPGDVRFEADRAVAAAGWRDAYYVDADHIGLATVDKFISSSDFYTVDVADFIGKPANEDAIREFVRKMATFKGKLTIPGMQAAMDVDDELLRSVASKYLAAVANAEEVYRHVAAVKGAGNFVTEISVDESNTPQSPAELFFLLAAIAQRSIPIQTIAPKFTGAFLKGVDYVGDVARFEQEFEDDLAVIRFAVKTFGLPDNLKLSVHSGSDKFSLYPVIHRLVRKHGAGLHLKTAGTTWLEEAIGLASAGGDGLEIVKEIYTQAFNRFDEMCGPYLAVIHIQQDRLPHPSLVSTWNSQQFAGALRHVPSHKLFDNQFRQLMHVGYKVAAELGEKYTNLLEQYKDIVAENVTENIYKRHLLPLFVGEHD